MDRQIPKDYEDRKRKPHARADRIIEKRQNWKDYLDPEEDPGLLEDEDWSPKDEKDEVSQGAAEQEEEEGSSR